MKVCKTCKVEKETTDFYGHPKTADRLDHRCKECTKAYQAERRKGPSRESIIEYDRKRGRDNEERKAKSLERNKASRQADPERMSSYAKNWIARNPEKRKAHIAVANAVRDGRLVKGSCEFCGTADHIQAHHDDYEKPLDVRWVCRKHHGLLHRKDRLHER